MLYVEYSAVTKVDCLMVESGSVELETDRKEMRRQAILSLTRREHSAKELLQKLIRKGYESEQVLALLDNLIDEGLQSDQRFAENYVRFRRKKGFGPVHIQQELQRRGVSKDIITAIVNTQDAGWLECLERARHKRFGPALPANPKDRAKQSRFLAYRGFSQEQITGVFCDDEVF